MQKAGKRIHPKIYYYVNEEKVVLEHDKIISAKPFFKANLIGTIMKGLTLELKEMVPFTEIYFSNTAKYNGVNATKTYGPYYLKETPTYNADTKTYTHNLYDSFIRTMVDYNPLTITYPTTLLEFFKQLCLECGFTTSITSLPNGSRIIESDIYAGIGYTYRDIFDDIGEATGTLFKIKEFNVEKCALGDSEIIINDDILRNQNIALGDHFGPINSVILSRSGDSDIIYKRDETLTSWNEFKISDNQLMNDNNRSDYLEELYNALYGIEYDIFDLELIGYGGFEPLQKINITTYNGEETKTYNSYVFNNEQEFTQGYKESIYTEMPEENETDYKTADTTDKRLNKAFLLVDKQNKLIQGLVEETTKSIKTIEEILEHFSVDLDIYNITVSTNQDRYSLENKNYYVNYSCKFEGTEVSVTPVIENNNVGINAVIESGKLKISVDSTKVIESLSNEITLTFIYKNNDDTYALNKNYKNTIKTFAIDDKFIEQGTTEQVLRRLLRPYGQ